MAVTLDDVFGSPDHYLHSFDGDAAIFVPMDRAAYHRSIFLDHRISLAADGNMPVSLSTLTATLRPPAPTGWIFHVAHCGSTLFARALDRLAGNLVLREPLALRQVALAPDARRLQLVAAMLGKRYRADAPTLVKANVPVNFLLPDLATVLVEPRVILLWLPLRDYLLAILRNDNHRGWLRQVTTQLQPHLGDLSALSDAGRAAALWLAQMRAFAVALGRWPEARTLDAEQFFARPAEALRAATALFAIDLGDADVDAVIAGPLFSTYSKNPTLAFDNAARVARRRELEVSLGGELAQAQAWVERTAGDAAPYEAVLRAAALSR